MNAGGSYGAATSYARKLLAKAMLGIQGYNFDQSTNTLTIVMDDGTPISIQFANPKSLEFKWDGTKLGIRQEGDATYSYTDLGGGDVKIYKYATGEVYKKDTLVLNGTSLYLAKRDTQDTTQITEDDFTAISGSGDSSGVIGESWVTNVEGLGIPANTTINADMKVTEFLKALTLKYISPVITSFTGSASTLNCTGDVISGTTLTANVTKKSNPITSVKFSKGGVVLTTDTSKPNGGTYTYGYGANITSDTTFKVEVYDGRTTITKLLEYKFINPMYYGMLSTSNPTESDITGLTKLVEVKGNKTLSFTDVNKRATFAYPASYGNLQKIEDQNTFDNTSGFTKSTVTINGVAYNVYQSGSATLNGFKYTFKFV